MGPCPDLSWKWCVLLSLSPSSSKSNIFVGLCEIHPARKWSTHAIFGVFLGQHVVRRQIKSGLLHLCTLDVSVYWWPESKFGRKGCLSVLRKWYQINKLFPDPWVSPLCQVTTPTANSSVLSCHLLARLTPEAGERRCGNRRGCVLTRRVWESYEYLSILMSRIKWLPPLGLNAGHEG